MTKSDKKMTSKRHRRANRKLVLPCVAPQPKSMRQLMTYSAVATFGEAAAGTGGTYFYRLNSVYDPDASGVGAAALGYATWAGMFLNYKVHTATVRLQGTVSAGTGTSMLNGIVMAPVPYQAVVPTNKLTWRTLPGAKFKAVAPLTFGGPSIVNFTSTYDLAKITRCTKDQYQTDMDFSGAVGSNPTRQIYLLVGVDSIGSSTAVNITYSIQITYLVEWFNPIPVQ